MGGAAAGEVAGGRGGGGRRRPLGSGLPGLQWPPDLEEGAGGGGGPAAEAVRPAEGAAARERRRPVNSQSIANHGAVAWKGDGREVQKPVCLHA